MINTFYRQSLLVVMTTLIAACQFDEGKVVDESGSPLVGVEVLIGTQSGVIHTRITDEEGLFSYAGIDDGNLVITADAEGYHQVTQKAGSQFTFTLKPDDSPDSDNDALSDNEERSLGTSPYDADTDHDGLPDSLESRVMYPVPLVSMGVSPLRKDLLIEMDWDENRPETKITDVAVALLKTAFSNAPISNPDGSSGIKVHVDRGEFGGGDGVDQQLSKARLNIFYHTDTSNDLNSLFGYADLPGRNHWVQGDFSSFGVGEGFVEAIVLMHELGHNLGLYHGGNDNVVCKPNYPSVMNYNPFMALSFSYSKGGLAVLNEHALDEHAGIGFGAVDWNKNFRFDDELVEANIDGHTPINIVQWLLNIVDVSSLPYDLSVALSPSRCIPNYETPYHRDHNDWAVIEPRLDDDLNYVLSVLSVSEFKVGDQSLLMKSERVNDIFEFPAPFFNILSDTLDKGSL